MDSDPSQEPQEPEAYLPGMLQDAGMLLAFAGLALFGVFLSNLFGVFIPPRALDPAWQLRLGELLIGSSPFALLGSCLLLIAACLDPDHPRIEAWWQRTRQLAWIACLGYLLLIPLQASALLRMGSRVEQPAQQQIDRLRGSRTAIARSRDLGQLNRALRDLPGSPQLPPNFNRPLDAFRREATARLDERLIDLQAEQRLRNRNRRVGEVLLFLRLGGISAILSGVFAAFAMRDAARGSWLEQLALMRAAGQERKHQRFVARSSGGGVDPYLERLARQEEEEENAQEGESKEPLWP